MKIAKTLVAAAAAAAATVAMAAVTIDFTTGTGFVGKGDVQTAVGWNNAQLQDNAYGLVFLVKDHSKYSFDCDVNKLLGNGVVMPMSHEGTTNINLNVSFEMDPRRANQVNGFILGGMQGGGNNKTAPVDGGSCEHAGETGLISNVQTVFSNQGLFVKVNGTDYPLN